MPISNQSRRNQANESQPELICYTGPLPTVKNVNYDAEDENSFEYSPFNDGTTTFAKENNTGQYSIDNFVLIMNQFRKNEPTKYPIPFSYLRLSEQEKEREDKYDVENFKYTEDDIENFQDSLDSHLLLPFNINKLPALISPASNVQKEYRTKAEKHCENTLKKNIYYITSLFNKSDTVIKKNYEKLLEKYGTNLFYDIEEVDEAGNIWYSPNISTQEVESKFELVRDESIKYIKKILASVEHENRVAYLRTSKLYNMLLTIQFIEYNRVNQQSRHSQPTPSRPRLVRTSRRDNLSISSGGGRKKRTTKNNKKSRKVNPKKNKKSGKVLKNK